MEDLTVLTTEKFTNPSSETVNCYSGSLNQLTRVAKHFQHYTPKAEQDLLAEKDAAIAEGDEERAEAICQDLALHNLGFILSKVTSNGTRINGDSADLVMACYEAMLDCAYRYDVSRNSCRLISYAERFIEDAIHQAIRKLAGQLNTNEWRLNGVIGKYSKLYQQEFETDYIDAYSLAEYILDHASASERKDAEKACSDGETEEPDDKSYFAQAERLAKRIDIVRQKAEGGVSLDGSDSAEDGELASLSELLPSSGRTDDGLVYADNETELLDLLSREVGTRNRELFIDCTGYGKSYPMSTADLMVKYGMSAARISQIKDKINQVLSKHGLPTLRGRKDEED